MRFHALACDYDGTVATGGRVDEHTAAALERLARTGRRLILITGRRLDDLARAFDRLDLFDVVVAENGAVLHRSGQSRTLAEAPPGEFVQRLRDVGVQPLDTGSVIVATGEPNDVAVLETIRDLGLELQVIFNKGAVMVLPSGVNKASGLAAAVAELGLSAHNVAGVGDAENDHAFLAACECAVAVANALPAVKERCDLVTSRDHGAGVAELIDRIVDNDLSDVPLTRHDILLGSAGDQEVRLSPYGTRLMVAGPSHSGRSTVTAALLERIGDAGYQFCLIDPEGYYADGLENALVIGDARRAPALREVAAALRDPDRGLVVNLLGVPPAGRPAFFEELLPHVMASRSRWGRPHWLVIDEAHHLLPAGFDESHQGRVESASALAESGSLLLVTAHPEAISEEVRNLLTGVVAVGDRPSEILECLARPVGADDGYDGGLATGELLIWQPSEGRPVRAVLRNNP